MKNLCFLFMLFLTINTFAKTHKAKRQFYVYWGWNREEFTKSNIHFSGSNYNFSLYDVVAKDRQTKFTLNNYFNPLNLSTPQYNFRFGYFINNKYDISLAMDHMKYVMQNNQTVKINGIINGSATKYDGLYENDNILLSPDFLKYEHTNGLNYLNLELRRNEKLYSKKWFSINTNFGAGLGALIPRTDATLLNNKRYDEFHLAGYGISVIAGLNLKVKYGFFVQSELKVGFINLPDVRTTSNINDKAEQSFGFLQRNIVFGKRFSL